MWAGREALSQVGCIFVIQGKWGRGGGEDLLLSLQVDFSLRSLAPPLHWVRGLRGQTRTVMELIHISRRVVT